jgi:Holliday junction DNA helicase RuvA
MYKYISGTVVDQGINYIVIDNNGIGYLVYVPNPFSYALNEKHKVFLYNHIREDENSLYGFKSDEELELFLKLINVKGLGPKVASNFFATGSIGGIVDAINRENLLYLTKFPKVGEKLAKQIILDLKGKINIDVVETNVTSTDELYNVLESLGYKSSEIKKVLPSVDYSKPLEEQIKEALKFLLR